MNLNSHKHIIINNHHRRLILIAICDIIRTDVLNLLDLKMKKPEIAEGKRFEKLNEYLNKSILEIEEQIKNLPSSYEKSWDELNKVLLSVLK